MLTSIPFQFFVSVICVVIALPVSLFIENLFEQANEVEGVAESWLSFDRKVRVCSMHSLAAHGLTHPFPARPPQWKRFLGAHAHADWHWSDKGRPPPSELVRWLAGR